MVTFLGTAGKISQDDVVINAIKKSELLFLEGYLWDEGEPKRLLIEQLTMQKKLLCLFLIYFV